MNDGQTLKTSKRYPDVPDHLIRRIQADTLRDFANSNRLDKITDLGGDVPFGELDSLLLTMADELELLEDGNFGEQD